MTVNAKSVGVINLSSNATVPLTLTSANSTNNDFKLVANGDVSISATLPNAKSIVIDASAATAANIAIKAGTLGGVNTTDSIQLHTGASGSISSTGTLQVKTSGGSLTLDSASGNIGTSTAAIKINTPALNVTAPNALFVNLSNLNKSTSAAATVSNISTTGAITFATAGPTIFSTLSGSSVKLTTTGNTTFDGDVTATASDISITQATGLLTISAGKTFSTTSNTGTGRITIQEKSTVSGAGINIGNMVTFNTLSANNASSKFPLNGQITIVVAPSLPTGVPVAGKQPGNVHVDTSLATGPANTVYWGQNEPITTATGVNNFTIKGNSAIVFSAASANAPITLGGSTSFTADPPVSAAPLLVAEPLSTAVPTGTTAVNHISSPQTLHASLPGTGNSLKSTTNQISFSAPSAISNSFSAGSNLMTAATQTDLISNSTFAKASVSNMSFGSGSNFEPMLTGSAEFTDTCSDNRITEHGAKIYAPLSDTKIKTAFGEIAIDANCLVAIFCTERGTSIFNLDDSHRNAVRLTHGTHHINIPAGRHISVSSSKSFDSINPVESIGHRKFNEIQFGGFKVFESEFSIPSAINALKPLKQILSSNEPSSQRIKRHLMKTIASLLQMNRSSERFQQILAPRMAAYAENH